MTIIKSIKYGSLIDGGVDVGLYKFRLGVKAIIIYSYYDFKIFIFYSQDMAEALTPSCTNLRLTKWSSKSKDNLKVVGAMLRHVRLLIATKLMKAIQPQIQESTYIGLGFLVYTSLEILPTIEKTRSPSLIHQTLMKFTCRLVIN